jgi:hypothetical protein
MKPQQESKRVPVLEKLDLLRDELVHVRENQAGRALHVSEDD